MTISLLFMSRWMVRRIKKGVDLMEFSQILLSVGCWQAVVSMCECVCVCVYVSMCV